MKSHFHSQFDWSLAICRRSRFMRAYHFNQYENYSASNNEEKRRKCDTAFPTNFLSFLFCWRCYCCCCCFCFCCCTINQSTASKLCENSIQMRLIIKSCIFLERFDAIYFGLAPLYIIGIVIEKRCANGIITVFSFLLACLLFSLLLLLVFKLKFYVSEYVIDICFTYKSVLSVCMCAVYVHVNVFFFHAERCSPYRSIGCFADNQSACPNQIKWI